jgi:hypothetical protein
MAHKADTGTGTARVSRQIEHPSGLKLYLRRTICGMEAGKMGFLLFSNLCHEIGFEPHSFDRLFPEF